MTSEISAIASIRRNITFIIVSLCLGLGYSIFFGTTSIYRADLPVSHVSDLASNIQNSLHFSIPIYINLPDSLAHFIPQAQESINGQLYQSFPHLQGLWSVEFLQGKADPNDDYVVNYNISKEVVANTATVSPFNKEITLQLSPESLNQESVVPLLSSVLLGDVFAEEIGEFSRVLTSKKDSNLMLPYSSNYNLIFSLFTESGKTIEWDIDQSLALFHPILDKLSHYTNFTISSQIQYYSNLADDLFLQEEDKRVVNKSELSTFINFGDWNLFTHDINPTINFLVFFPKANYDNIPSIIEDSLSNSFLVPQWGGVYILNKPMAHSSDNSISKEDLLPVMETFASHLFQLLGMPQHPKSPSIRVDTLTRTSIFVNLKQSLDNLNSLIKLTDSLNEISIPELTKQYVLTSIDFINKAKTAVEKQQFNSAMTFSAKALQNSNDAFFEKEMVQQAYFPSEHKMAVFLPLIGPVTTVCALGLLKLVLDAKKQKKAKESKKDE